MGDREAIKHKDIYENAFITQMIKSAKQYWKSLKMGKKSLGYIFNA